MSTRVYFLLCRENGERRRGFRFKSFGKMRVNDDDSADAWEAGLGATWSEKRKACAKGLGGLATEAKIERMERWAVELREDGDWRRQEGLCLALGFMATKEIAPVLEACLDGLVAALGRPQVRTAAAKALGIIAKIVAAVETKVLASVDDAPEGALTTLALMGKTKVPSLEQLRRCLSDEASTVRQSAANLLQKIVLQDTDLVTAVLLNDGDWRFTEGKLMALDGILSDDAIRTFADGESSLEVLVEAAKADVVLHFQAEACFEVQRAARQLATTVAIGELMTAREACLGLELLEREDSRGGFLLSVGCLFARYCDEDGARRSWGSCHDGAGDDAVTVQDRENAVARATPEKLQNIVDRFSGIAVQALTAYSKRTTRKEDAIVVARLVAFLAGNTSHQQLVKESWERWCEPRLIEDSGFRRQVVPVLADAMTVCCLTASDAVRHAATLATLLETDSRIADALLVPLRNALDAVTDPTHPKLQKWLRTSKKKSSEWSPAEGLHPTFADASRLLLLKTPDDHRTCLLATAYLALTTPETPTLPPPPESDNDWDDDPEDEQLETLQLFAAIRDDCGLGGGEPLPPPPLKKRSDCSTEPS